MTYSNGGIIIHRREPSLLADVVAPRPPAELWAVHVQGSDDIIPMPDRAEADRLVAYCDEYDRANAHRPEAPRMAVVVIPWPGTPEEHARGLAKEMEP